MTKLKITKVSIIDNHNAQVILENGEEIKMGGNWEIAGEPQVGDYVDTNTFLDPFMEVTYDLRTREHRSPFY